MKNAVRILSVVLIVTMLIGISGASASGQKDIVETLNDAYTQILQAIYPLYEAKGADIEDKYLEMGYLYLKCYLALSPLKLAVIGYDYGIDIDNSEFIRSYIVIGQSLDDIWIKYIDGEADKGTVAKLVFDLIKSQVIDTASK